MRDKFLRGDEGPAQIDDLVFDLTKDRPQPTTKELRPGFVWENGEWRRETPDEARRADGVPLTEETGGDDDDDDNDDAASDGDSGSDGGDDGSGNADGDDGPGSGDGQTPGMVGPGGEGKPDEEPQDLTPEEQFTRDLKRLGHNDKEIKELKGLVNSENPEDNRTARLIQAGLTPDSAREIAKLGEQDTADVTDLTNLSSSGPAFSGNLGELFARIAAEVNSRREPPKMQDTTTKSGPRG